MTGYITHYVTITSSITTNLVGSTRLEVTNFITLSLDLLLQYFRVARGRSRRLGIGDGWRAFLCRLLRISRTFSLLLLLCVSVCV